MRFKWEYITDKVRKSIVFAALRDGELLTAITQEGKEFQVEFINCVTRETEQEVLEHFLGVPAEGFEKLEEPKSISENARWKPFSRLYIRKDFADRLFPEIEKRESAPSEAVRRLLDPHDKLPRITVYQQIGGWEMIVMERQRIKEIDEFVKESERKLEGKTFEELLKDSISFDEFKKQTRAKLSELKEREEQ